MYLSWLKYAVDDVSSEWGELDPDIPEPVVPPGLNDLSDALSKFVAYFEIDKDIIEVAARMSTPLEPKAEIDFSSAIAQLTEDQKNDWLSRLINQEPMLSEKLKRQLSHKEAPKGQTSGRTVQQIADEVADIKQKREALQKQEAAKKELMRMQALEAQKGELWRQVDALIAEKKTKAYDEAIEILISLKSLAIYQDQFTSFKEQVETIKQQHTRLPGLISRLNSAGLTRK